MARAFESEALKKALDSFRAEFKHRLSIDQQRQFRFTNLHELENALYNIQQTQAKKGLLRNLPRIKSFLEAMQSLDRVVKVFLNSTDYLGFVWGPMKFLLEVASNFANAFDAMLEMYSDIGRTIPMLEQYEILFKHTPYLRDALVDIFKTILEFHLRAMDCFREKAWKKLFHAVWSTFKTQFKPYFKSLQDNFEVVKRHAELEHYRESQQQFNELRAYFADQRERFEQQKLHERDYQQAERDRRQGFLKQWLSVDDSLDQEQITYNERRGSHASGGQWLLQKVEMKNWLSSDRSGSKIVWMTGQPGAGKTILASLVVQHCEEQFEKEEGIAVLRFYCKNGDQARDSLLSVARSLIWQIYLQKPTLLDWLYEEAFRFGQAALTEKRCRDILKTAFENMDSVYLVVDGVDECCVNELERNDSNEPRKVINFFRSFLDRSSEGENMSLRCLLVSQSDNICPPLLSRYPTITITEQDNRGDILEFVQKECARLRAIFDLDDQQTDRIVMFVTSHAKGMFLYAVLVMRNLRHQTDRQSLENEVNMHLPTGVGEAYKRILHRVVDSEVPRRRERVLQVLGILAAARRPLKWREIQGALATVTDNRRVDYERLGLLQSARHLCSSLIDIAPNGNIEFVHSTAKEHLYTEGRIILQSLHFHLADVCLSLLTGPGFDAALPKNEAEIEVHAYSGYYAFADYATVFWAFHVEECLRHPAAEDTMSLLGENLDAFMQHNCVSSVKRLMVNNTLQELRWIKVCRWPRLKDIMVAVSAAEHQRQSNESNNIVNNTTNLAEKLQAIRSVVERLGRTPNKVLEKFYGRDLFKCPRIGCVDFVEGFTSADRRQAHLENHEKPWRCTWADCSNAEHGFGSEKDLREHLQAVHGEKLPLEYDDFPPRKRFKLMQAAGSSDEESAAEDNAGISSSKFACDLCSKAFTRKMNLDDHINSYHKGAKPHRCAYCPTVFSRISDRSRHEHGYHRDVYPFVCKGKLGSKLYDGEEWGCGRRFPRSDKLSQHYINPDGTSSGACIGLLVDQCRFVHGRSQYKCTGELKYVDPSRDQQERIVWGCEKEFRTSETLKKHWKSKKGRTICLKRILEGRENLPADSGPDERPTSGTFEPSGKSPRRDDGRAADEAAYVPLPSIEDLLSRRFLHEDPATSAWARAEPFDVGADFGYIDGNTTETQAFGNSWNELPPLQTHSYEDYRQYYNPPTGANSLDAHQRQALAPRGTKRTWGM